MRNLATLSGTKPKGFLYHPEFIPYKSSQRKMRPPRGLIPYYNMTESVISRKTAEFLLYNQVAREFRHWVQDIKAPEEFFYATLARVDQQSAINPGRFSVLQGSSTSVETRNHYKLLMTQLFFSFQDFDKDTTQGICPRYSNWNATTCHGLMKRWICNFSLGDLSSALDSKCIWINKFDVTFDPEAAFCLREFLVR